MNQATISHLTPAARDTLRALAPCIVADVTDLDDAGWHTLFATIDTALALRPPRMRRQLLLFLRIIELRALLRFRRPLIRLTMAERRTLLERFQDSRVLLLRRGFWGVRTLLLMGWYTQPRAADAIGYNASALGWDARA
jgi:hypothetical protein